MLYAGSCRLLKRNILIPLFQRPRIRAIVNTSQRRDMSRIVFTGGSGKAGRHVIPELVRRGHKVLNLDLIPLDNPDVFVSHSSHYLT